MENETSIRIRLPADLKEELQRACDESGMTMSETIRRMIKKGLNDEKES